VCNLTAILIAEFTQRQYWLDECAWIIGVKMQWKTEVFGERPVPVPLFAPKFQHGLLWD